MLDQTVDFVHMADGTREEYHMLREISAAKPVPVADNVLGLLKGAVDEFGQTVVMVSHDPRVASYADRVIVLSDGLVVHDGQVQSPDEVLALMQVD